MKDALPTRAPVADQMRSLSQAKHLATAETSRSILQNWIELLVGPNANDVPPYRFEQVSTLRRTLRMEQLWLDNNFAAFHPRATTSEFAQLAKEATSDNAVINPLQAVALLSHPSLAVYMETSALIEKKFDPDTAVRIQKIAEIKRERLRNKVPYESFLHGSLIWPEKEHVEKNAAQLRDPAFAEKIHTAIDFYMMPATDRELLKQIFDGTRPDSLLPTKLLVQYMLDEAEFVTSIKLAMLGMTMPEYFATYEALQTADIQFLRSMSKRSRERIDQIHENQQLLTTKQQYTDAATGEYSEERKKLHEEIVGGILKGLKSREAPLLGIFGGPMGAGKTRMKDTVMEEYKEYNPETNRYKTRKIALADPDKVRPLLMKGHYIHGNEQHRLLTQDEAYHVSDLVLKQALEQRLDIAIEGTFRNVKWIQDIILKNPNYIVEVGYMSQEELAFAFKSTIAFRTRGTALDEFLDCLNGINGFYSLANSNGVDRARIFSRPKNSKKLHTIYEQIGNNINADYTQLENVGVQFASLLQTAT